jgi:hypothetical protein
MHSFNVFNDSASFRWIFYCGCGTWWKVHQNPPHSVDTLMLEGVEAFQKHMYPLEGIDGPGPVRAAT